MKTTALIAALLLTITGVNAKVKTSALSVKDGGSEGHGYTTYSKSGEGNRPFLVSFDGEGVRGGLLDGGVGSRGGFRDGGASSGGGFNDEGGGVSGGGYQLVSPLREGGHVGNG